MRSSVYSIDNRVLTLGKDKDSSISIRLNNPIVQRYTSLCVLDSYTLLDRNLKYGNIFIESIDLENNCSWTGLASSHFETNLRYALNLNSIETVESFDISGYNFKTFRINGDSYLSMIYIYAGNSDKFILDYYGRLYTEVLKSFKPEYENRYLSKKRFIGDYRDSLVQKNLINHYFQRERIEIVPRIGISISL